MEKTIKKLFPLLLLLLFACGIRAAYFNGTSNGLAVPTSFTARPSRDSGILLSWKTDASAGESTFILYRAGEDGQFAEIGSTRENSYLDADSLVPGTGYSYKLVRMVSDYYGDGEPVYSDPTPILTVTCVESAPLPNDFSNSDDMVSYLIGRIRKADPEIAIFYSGKWEDGLWENLLAKAEAVSPSLRWNYESVSGSCRYEGRKNGTDSYLLTYVFSYYMGEKEAEALDNTLPEIVAGMREQYSLGTNPGNYNIAKAIYTYLCKNVTFDASERHLLTRSVSRRSAYDALHNRRASSQGIALAAKMLFDYFGVPCEVISGDGHCFNLVSIDGWWYSFDAASGISLSDSSFVSYRSFLFNDDRFGKDPAYSEGSEFFSLHPLGKESVPGEPDAPTLLSCVTGGEKITISLSYKGDGALIYADGFLLGDCKSDTFVHSDPTPGKVYRYSVVAYTVDRAGEKLLSRPAEPFSAVIGTAAKTPPTALSVKQTGKDLLTLSFTPAENTSSFDILDGESGKVLASSSLPPVSFRPGKESGSLSVRVKGSGEHSEKISYRLFDVPSIPEILPLDGKSVLLSFGSEASRLIRRTHGNESVDYLCLENSFTDENLLPGECYSYRVCYTENDAFGPFSEEITFVPLLPPTMKEAKVTENGILVEWKTEDETYSLTSLFRAEGENGDFVCLGTPENGSSYLDKDVISGRTYSYKVCAVGEKAAHVYELSRDSEIRTVYYLPPCEVESLVRNQNGDTVILTWSESEKVDGYRILRRNGGETEEFYTDSKPTFTDSEVIPEKTYVYSVTPFRKENGQRQFGKESKEVTSHPFLSARFYTDQAQTFLEWNACPGADGYLLFRSTGENYTAIAVTKELSYAVSNVANAVNSFKVLPYFDTENGRSFGQENYFSPKETPVRRDEETPPLDTSEKKEPTESFFSRLFSSAFTPIFCAVILIIAGGYLFLRLYPLLKNNRKESGKPRK